MRPFQVVPDFGELSMNVDALALESGTVFLIRVLSWKGCARVNTTRRVCIAATIMCPQPTCRRASFPSS